MYTLRIQNSDTDLLKFLALHAFTLDYTCRNQNITAGVIFPIFQNFYKYKIEIEIAIE
jgi:hypothetical protein